MHRVLNIINAFEALRARRGDDEFTANWKAKQREVCWSMALTVLALFGGFAVTQVLDVLESNRILAGVADMLRQPAGYAFLAFAGFFLLRMFLAWWNLLRSARMHGRE